MRTLVLVALVACKQDKTPAPPPPAVPRDAPIDAPPPLARFADPPRLRLLLDHPDPGSIGIRFDTTISAIRPDDALEPGSAGWRVTLAAPVTIVEGVRDRKESPAVDEMSRSFVLDVPKGVAVDLRVGQHLHGSINEVAALMQFRTYGEASDERGKVFEVGSGPIDMKLGKVTHDIESMPFENLHEVEVQLDGKTWSSLAGWSRWASYAVYGLAGDLKDGAIVDDYFPWRAFAMIRHPG